MERHEQVGVERVPQPQLVAIRPSKNCLDVDAVAAFRRRGQPEQLLRLQVVEQPAVGGRHGVVELVDDDDVEVVGLDALDAVRARDWMLAKTCFQRSGLVLADVSSPKAPSGSTSR